MQDTDKFQFLIGMGGVVFGFVIVLINLVINLYAGNSFETSFLTPEVLVLGCFAGMSLVSAVVRVTATKLLQVVALLLSGGLVIQSDYQSFFGIWSVTIAIVLSLKYGFFNRFMYWKVGVIVIYVYAAALTGATAQDVESAYTWPLRLGAFLLLDLGILWVIFEADIRKLRERNHHVEKDLERKIPLAKIGENTAGVIHSLRNVLNRISMGLIFIESNLDAEKGLKLIRRGLEDTTGRLQEVLEMSRMSGDDSMDTVQLKKFIEGFHRVFFEDIFRQEGIVFNVAGDEKFVLANKQRFILMLENIFQNAIEALRTEKPESKILTVGIYKEGFSIANNGGMFPKCEQCDISTNCLECTRFQTIGWTTKENGTGNGIPHIVRTCKEFGWGFQIQIQKEVRGTCFKFITKDA